MICWEEESLLSLDFLTPHSLIISLSNMIFFGGEFQMDVDKDFFSLIIKNYPGLFESF